MQLLTEPLTLSQYLHCSPDFLKKCEQYLRPLNELQPHYRSSLKRSLMPFINEEDVVGLRALLSPLLQSINLLKSRGLSVDSGPRQIAQAKKHPQNTNTNIKQLFLQELEKIDLLLCRHRNDRSIVSQLTFTTHKRYQSFVEAGLRSITTPYTSSSLYVLKEERQERLVAELVECLQGTCSYYQSDCGYAALSAVITAPAEHQLFSSNRHALRALGANRKSTITPRDVHRVLQKKWKRVRSAFQAKGIKTIGLATTEPNQIGLPHLNLLLFFKKQEEMNSAALILKKYFGSERNEVEHQLFINKNIENPLRWAYYITENIRKEKYPEVIDPRIKIWHEIWGIRRYNFFGQLPIQHFRDLQNLSQTNLEKADNVHQLSSVFINLWQSASAQPFAGSKSSDQTYSYRNFLLLTETDHIVHSATSGTLPAISFEKHLIQPASGQYALKIIDRSKPQLHIRLCRTRSILSKTIKDKVSGKDLNKNYVKYTIQLYVIIPRNRGSPTRDLNGYKPYR